MKSTSRFILMSITALLTLTLSAVMTVPVLADDSAPPPADPPVEVVNPPEPVGDSAPADSAPADSAPVVDSAPTDSAPADSAPVDSVPVTDTTTLPELLGQLPEGTDVVVTNGAGETVPLATEEAAQAIMTGDPIWCPTGIAPKPGLGGCTATYTTLSDLVTGFVPTGNGTIWIENVDFSGVLTSNSVVIDGGAGRNWDTASGYSLTLQGGWNGGATLASITGVSTFDTYIQIINWTGAVTVKNITIDGVTDTPVAADTEDYALVVKTTGNITLSGVTVVNSNDADMGGALLNNVTGIGTVMVTNGIFNNNDGSGLVVNSTSSVTTNNLVANGNDAVGVLINNASGTTDKPVTMKGFKQFNGNGEEGLYIVSRGAVNISNVNANDNGSCILSCTPSPSYTGIHNGVTIKNPSSAAKLGVTITGTNYFMNNTGNGLYVLSHGVITVSNINAMYNGSGTDGYGAFLDNCEDNGSRGCSPLAVAKSVIVTGVNNLSWNAGSGLYVLSLGTITTYSITADNNAFGSGAILDNSRSNTGAAGVVMYGSNYFSNNGDDISDAGLTVWSHGAITVNNITASFNFGRGAFLDNCNDNDISTPDASPYDCASITYAKNITLTGVNTFNGNYIGLRIYSFGSVIMNNVTANNNIGKQGALIHNDTNNIINTESAGIVSLAGYGIFNSNYTDGLAVFSHGNIYLTNVTANSNGNTADGGDGVSLATERASGGASVTLSGTNTFNYNYATGLTIDADGAITTSSLTANSNGLRGDGTGYGIYLINNTATSPAMIKLLGYARVDNNPQEGLFIDSSGAVIAYNITATNNGFDCIPGPCTGTNSHGVSITNITKDADSLVVGDNNNLLTPQNVVLYGTNTFSNNDLNGLDVVTYGAIVLYNITADNNGQIGLNLDNHGATLNAALLLTPGSVSILGYVRVSNNVEEGLYIDTRGAVSLTNIYANNNGWTPCTPAPCSPTATPADGIYIKNNYDNHTNVAAATGVYSKDVTITGVNTFTNNSLNGLYVLSYGIIKVNSVTATMNGANGVYLNNCKTAGTPECPVPGLGTYFSVNKGLTLTGRNLFYMNGFDGLNFSVSGVVSLTGVTANYNGTDVGYAGEGIRGTSTGAMTLTCTHLYGNENNSGGYDLTSAGLITLNGIYSSGTSDTAVSVPAAVIKVNLLCP